ncbi:hypothetical protein [Propionicimonas sp.]|uniref:hypothetical protein n=1 Tax=Propionicimonas sp. TaxID=1955623 RepID=UPI00178D716C|nr:hypothetical protein [Propionicimonas sp.]MBU3975917.1 hypothetical protein [Actinomycetota bacterium]MBA3020733.1 hypothetical protein [Propionicimonas sp.]MBU3985107.1 hypothetical protein [Actinomycetota bacterium]MBU4008097.1 hypothetical protein [Actinomycetota bacterium]MBU4064689.1 hypothetical protein [Actinomycetota bacterium]
MTQGSGLSGGATLSAVWALADAHPVLRPVLDEHLTDNDGELLAHLVIADFVRWLVAHQEAEPGVCADVLAQLESEFAAGPDEVRGLIAVSGVEMIPDPGQPGSELRALLGPGLASVDPWLNPSASY